MRGTFAAALSLAAAVAGAGTAPTVEDRFGWIAGCWAGEHDGAAFREIWVVAAPDLMVGMSVTTRPSKPAQFEYLRIEGRDGRPAYVGQPGGAPPTRFEWRAGEATAESVVFANPQHDFPKRIGYRRVAPDGLLAWIDGGDSGAARAEYPMKRAACP
jgi:hypothetical protein